MDGCGGLQDLGSYVWAKNPKSNDYKNNSCVFWMERIISWFKTINYIEWREVHEKIHIIQLIEI